MKNVAFTLVTALVISSHTQASILWQGNFETGDIQQWDTPINPAGLSVTSACVFDGKYAGKVRLTGDESFLWNGNKQLNRSEFHHRRTAGETYEGKDTFFAFSFYLPKQLSEHKHELGYWESDKSWQQMLRFNISGSELSFQETAAKEVLWKLPKGAAPGQWHRVALHI
ncbi:MAG TPA: heparin lyase I family protein, partial [Cellvibrio sp.]|nr:heparin lyase I family protein [Cellvibrio sp.]